VPRRVFVYGLGIERGINLLFNHCRQPLLMGLSLINGHWFLIYGQWDVNWPIRSRASYPKKRQYRAAGLTGIVWLFSGACGG